MKKWFFISFLFLSGSLYAMTYDSGGGAAGADQGDILSGSNANAVMYTNGSKAITTDTVFTYNGTTATVTGLSVTTGVITNLIPGGLTSNRVPYYNGSKIVDGANLLFDGTTSTITTLSVTNLNPSALTTNRVPYYNGTKLIDGAALTFDGTTSTITTLSVTNLNPSGLTTNRVPYYNGTKLIDNANMTFDGTTSTITTVSHTNATVTSTLKVGTALSGSGSLQVGGNIDVGGADVNLWNLSNNALIFGTNSAARCKITNGGNFVFDGIGLGGAGISIAGSNIFKVSGGDNSTVYVSSINATQANITASDVFMSFESNTGQEASIAGTGVAGVIAYNTFTGAHFTKLIDADPKKLDILTPLESTGKVIDKIPGLASKDQLVESRPCKTRASKSILGFYAGTDGKKESALAIGAGLVWVANKGIDIQPGDLLISSDVEGAVELQDDDILRQITIAKARESIHWKSGEKKRKIAVVYICG